MTKEEIEEINLRLAEKDAELPAALVSEKLSMVAELYSADLIAEGRARGIVSGAGRFYVVTGSRWCGTLRCVYGVECIPLEKRARSHPKPRTYARKCAALDALWDSNHRQLAEKLRKQFYSGMVIKFRNRSWLLLGRVRFLQRASEPVAKQLEMSL